jgi:hypothetical protein
MKCAFTAVAWILVAAAADGEPFTFAEDPPAKSESPDAAQPKSRSSAPPRTQWLMFTAEWCPACRIARAYFEVGLKRGGWMVDSAPAAHVRLIDADREPELVRTWNVRAFPTFVLMQGDRELRRTEGYPGRGELVDRFRNAEQAALRNVRAVSVGTLKGERQNIANVIAAFRPILGDGGTLTVTLDRRGESEIAWPIDDRITVLAGNPLTMTYSLQGDVLTCRFAEPHPRGRFQFGVPVEQAVSSVTLSVDEVVIALPRAPDLRLRVEP